MAQMKFRAIYVIAALFGILMSATSCVDTLDEFDLTYTKNGEMNESELTISVTRDSENGIIEASRIVNGLQQDTVITVNLGAVEFEISPVDTIQVASAEVVRSNFAEVGEEKVEDYEENEIFFTKTTRHFVDSLSGYQKDITISYLDAYTYVWGELVEFPKANGNVEVVDQINVLDEGIKDDLHYFTATTQYSVSFMDNASTEKGLEVLTVNAEDELLSTEKTNEGYETLSESTALSWVEITRTYKISGEVVTRYEVVLNNGVTSPAYEVMNVESFDLAAAPAHLSEAVVVGTRTEGNIEVSKYSQNYTVANNLFDRTFVLSYETATLTVDGKIFDMPSRRYENITDENFQLTSMEGITGYERALYTHYMSASFNEAIVEAQAEVELRMVEVTDELVSREVIEEGLDYLNATTTKSWIKIREIWSVGGEKIYTKSVNLTNGIAEPSKITRKLNSFDLVQSNANLSNEELVNSETRGEFKVMTYAQTYTVGNDQFTREFTLSYQKAEYLALNHNMPYNTYKNISDNGFSMSDLSEVSEGGKVYDRKNYAHKMSATFSGRSAEAVAEAELLVEVENNRETPSWLGNPVGAKYTRVQKAVGDPFTDMIVFIYENGVVMAPNGKVNMNLTYAFNASVAAANNVEQCIEGAYSGVFGDGKWQPATITIAGSRWFYIGIDSAWDHAVMEANAVTLGIGVDVTPIPDAQSVKIENGVITISYAANNGSNTATTSLSLK